MRKLVIVLFIVLGAATARAGHISGGEIGYKHISGLTYEIQLNIYGDCRGGNYDSLFNSNVLPRIAIYDSNAISRVIVCERYGDYGKEITPICPKDSLNTACKNPNGALPGIAEFKFRKEVTLPNTSGNWRFVFSGDMGPTIAAGRSGQITNITQTTSTTLVYLEATLNNLNGSNSTPTLSTIPTPFFCINQPQSYNPGASDADGDVLNVSLIDGITGTGVPLTSYIPPFTGAQPLATSSFNFNTQTGQLSFTPNQVQISLVVNLIEEFRNGVKVGSMMREMNFIVLNNCNNQSPSGSIVSNSIGTLNPLTQTISKICYPDTMLNLVIEGADLDSNNINLSVNGLPAAFYNVTNNNTPNPQLTIDYPITYPAQGTQIISFFVTYQDDACPLASNQQVAYTIELEQPITMAHTVIGESCIPANDGIINLNATSTNTGGLTYSFNGGPFQSLNTFTSLNAGNYEVVVRDSLGCIATETLRLDSAVEIDLIDVNITDITCGLREDGMVTASSVPSSLPSVFSLLPTTLSNSSGRFSNLAPGNYTLIVDGPKGCSDSAMFSITEPPAISFENINIIDNRCNLANGRIELSSNITIPAEYSISPNQQTNASGNFGGLIAGQYIITVVDTNGCYKDTLIEVKDDPGQMQLSLSKQDISCEGDGSDGSAGVFVAGAIEPISYRWESIYGVEGTGASIFDQRSGVKRVFVTDAIGCAKDGYIVVEPANCCNKVFIPNAFSPNGDGRNETFNIRSPLTMNNVKFIVANRWGQIVWSTNNQLDSWDGNYANGTPADNGVYYYFLRYQCDSDKESYKVKGDVTIIR